jgi:hypothetical protein
LFFHKHVLATALISRDASHSVNQDNGQEVNTRWKRKRRKNPNEWRFREKTPLFIADLKQEDLDVDAIKKQRAVKSLSSISLCGNEPIARGGAMRHYRYFWL